MAQTALAIPGGSYTESCRAISQHGKMLKAQCLLGHQYVWASFDTTPCPNGPIGNSHGRLFCEFGTAYPSGSWQESCRSPRLNGVMFTAECQVGHDWPLTSLNMSECPGGPVGNEQGKLFCEGETVHGANLPGGNWQGTCKNATIEGLTLYAQCRDSQYRYHDTQLSLTSCPSQIVSNKDGTLVCEAKP